MKKFGFTTLEFSVAISVIAMLYFFAMPRYVALQHQARITKAQSLYNTVRAAATLTKAMCLSEKSSAKSGNCNSDNGFMMFNNYKINMQNQYPEASLGAGGIIEAAQINEEKDSVSISSTGSGMFRVINIDVNGAEVGRCRVSYSAPLRMNEEARISVIIAGC